MSDDGNSTSDSLMLMMMMQTMGSQPIGMEQIMPLILLTDSDSDDSLLLMVMMNSMSGGLNSQSGFDSNFNLLLPLIISDCVDSDVECKKKHKNMMVLMMAMQSQVKLSRMYLIYKK